MSLKTNSRFIPEIQFLRAIAVLAVFIFHMYPDQLPGGYIGVDIFFVLSGFLMTRTMMHHLERHGTIGIKEFYFRRGKRILPAALVVLFCTAVLSTVFLPFTVWKDIGHEIAASAIWLENYRLVFESVDYLAGEEAISPVMHYWSLSVEEQFYIFYPLFFTGLLLLGTKQKTIPPFVSGLLLLTLASFTYSIFSTLKEPAAAYFDTPTRMWELTSGGLLYFVRERFRCSEKMAQFLALSGLIAACVSACYYSSATPFPGYAAILPLLCPHLIILGGTSSRRQLYSLFALKPFQFIGDISYSIYLWHWPLIIFHNTYLGRDFGILDGCVFIGATCVLAYLTKIHVEDRFRYFSFNRTNGFKLARYSAASIVFVAGCGLLLPMSANRMHDDFILENPPLGALASINFTAYDTTGPFIPTLARAKDSIPKSYADKSHLGIKDVTPILGEYGDRNGSETIVLIGDSHAAQWLPALDALGKKFSYRVLTSTKSGCIFMPDVMLDMKGRPYTECQEWTRMLLDEIKKMKPLAVVFSSYLKSFDPLTTESQTIEAIIARSEVYAESLSKVMQQIERNGTHVLLIADTPRPAGNIVDCVAQNQDAALCSFDRDNRYDRRIDFIRATADKAPDIDFIDLKTAICPAQECVPVLGDILLYRDSHHLTVEFAESLAPFLEPAILNLSQ